ncbi:MAG TPA: hypothetical protein VLT87_10920 [Thermoanaerobaculia bacterium]|nr:hypothetical protein [Thermoanaerobaculia bacterium]
MRNRAERRRLRARTIARRVRRYWFLSPEQVETPGWLEDNNLTGCNCVACACERDRKRRDRRKDRRAALAAWGG